VPKWNQINHLTGWISCFWFEISFTAPFSIYWN